MTQSLPTIAEPDPFAALAAEASGVLGELTDMSMGFARTLDLLRERAVEAIRPSGPVAPEVVETVEGLAIAFAKISRAARQSLALKARFVREAHDRSIRKPAPNPPSSRDAALEDRRAQGRLRRVAAVHMAETAIHASDREAPERERLVEQLYGSPAWTAPEDADFAETEVDALALELCKTLGVEPDADWWDEHWGLDLEAGRPLPEINPPP